MSGTVRSHINQDLLTTSSIISDGLYNEFNSLNFENIHSSVPLEYREQEPSSQMESAILKSTEPIPVNVQDEEIMVNGERGLWINRTESLNWKGPIELNSYPINEDPEPEVIKKTTSQKLEYVQELAIRYLRPPTPPAPGDIIINKSPNQIAPPAPPIIIRQQPPRPSTPEPLVIREAPPTPPPQIGKKVITIGGKKIPPPPRKVIIERLAEVPAKPQSVIIERWLPYRSQKRKVIFNKTNHSDSVVIKPRNMIVQWEPPQVHIKKEFQYLGIVRANPTEYVKRYGNTLIEPVNLPKFVVDIQAPQGVVLASESKNEPLYELEGDIEALNYVDLEREGLSEYKKYVNKSLGYPQSKKYGHVESFEYETYTARLINNQVDTNNIHMAVGSVADKQLKPGQSSPVVSPSGQSNASVDSESIETLIEYLFKSVDTERNGKVNVLEGEKLLLKLNSRLDKQFNEEDVKSFFNDIAIGKDGLVDLQDFKRAFLNLISIS
ncbi:hypothetical protein BpHYR1_052784 [Brachionus plicatilis]|uniref:EF-hand domain-containing protein n=1 Tax=Brachionus plicatilis TaxID=10195 RepID=A0A3M7T0W9_BRAPC|nr:hypothetical protein BpHYR1_052784 [Brachionus plicatilis]